MRTKTLLLTAALGLVGVAGVSAQSVYSVNAVGYVNKLVVAGYTLIANPLNGTNNQLSTILPTPPDGSTILKWNPATQGFSEPYSYIDGLGWLPDGALTVNPGEGFFFNLPSGTATLTFVGDVPQGNLTNGISANYSLLSSVVPQVVAIDNPAFNFPVADGDTVLQWNSNAQTFAEPLSYIDGLGWLPNAPTITVGEGFFYNSLSSRNWTRSFSVN